MDATNACPGRSMMLYAAAGFVATVCLTARADKPRIPGAITSCPPWLKSGAPFDMERFFVMPAPEKNAAPLYLEAFAEFSPEADAALPPEARGRRVAVAGDRSRRLSELSDIALNDPAKLDVKAADTLLEELREGFRKIDAAQRRPDCVFAVGLSVEAIMPHAQAARMAGRAFWLRIVRDVQKGTLDRPLQDIGRLLRLSRDLRPRGPFVSQLVGAAIEAGLIRNILPMILTSPKLKPEHCDRLITLLNEHETKGLDCFATGAKAEYVMHRVTLRFLQEGRETKAGKDGKPADEKRSNEQVAKQFADFIAMTPLGAGDAGTHEKVAALIQSHGTKWGRDRKAFDDIAKTLIVAKPVRFADRAKQVKDLEARYITPPGPNSLWLVKLMLGGSYDSMAFIESVQRVSLGMAKGLVAARRWQLTHDGRLPQSLDAACREAKIATVPTDLFSTGGVKFTTLNGQPALYSVGRDGVDDQGLVDSKWGKEPKGDLVLGLPPSLK